MVATVTVHVSANGADFTPTGLPFACDPGACVALQPGIAALPSLLQRHALPASDPRAPPTHAAHLLAPCSLHCCRPFPPLRHRPATRRYRRQLFCVPPSSPPPLPAIAVLSSPKPMLGLPALAQLSAYRRSLPLPPSCSLLLPPSFLLVAPPLLDHLACPQTHSTSVPPISLSPRLAVVRALRLRSRSPAAGTASLLRRAKSTWRRVTPARWRLRSSTTLLRSRWLRSMNRWRPGTDCLAHMLRNVGTGAARTASAGEWFLRPAFHRNGKALQDNTNLLHFWAGYSFIEQHGIPCSPRVERGRHYLS